MMLVVYYKNSLYYLNNIIPSGVYGLRTGILKRVHFFNISDVCLCELAARPTQFTKIDILTIPSLIK